jgi:AraC-like DNA-binding protein
MKNQTYTLLDHQSGDLAFKLYAFNDIHHLDHVQRVNYYSIIWIQEGSGEAIIESEKYAYSDNQIYACSPYQPFMFSCKEETKGIILNFHPNFFCIHKHHTDISCDGVLFNNVYDYPFIEVQDGEANSLNWIIEEMMKDINQDGLAVNEAILSYLKLFLINCSRIKKNLYPEAEPSDHKKEESQLIKKLKKTIETHFRTLHSPKEYANLLHISPNALSKMVKQTFSKTLSTLIAERIVVEAKRELFLTNKTIEEIAYELGYEDPFYFSRFFKKHTQISPSVYRKTVGENMSSMG